MDHHQNGTICVSCTIVNISGTFHQNLSATFQISLQRDKVFVCLFVLVRFACLQDYEKRLRQQLT